jgi:hypothetical protein
MPQPLCSATVIGRAPGFLSAELDGETILLSIERGNYFGFDGVGNEVWRRLEAPMPVAALCAALAEIYDADPPAIERDMLPFLTEMLEAGLIEAAG